MKQRYLAQALKTISFENDKMAFVSGPRQVGKTTLAKRLLKEYAIGAYYNWDDIEFRRLWTKDPKKIISPSRTSRPCIILDEIHKAKGWKRSIKGVFDTLSAPADILVTGSARLNIYKRGGDSLLGRYFHFHLHPFSLRELGNAKPLSPDECWHHLFNEPFDASKERSSFLSALMQFGGFPDPIFKQDQKLASLWRKGRIEMIIREDVRDLSRIPELSQIEMLAALLPERVGSLLSLNSLREDLEVSHDTVKRWLQLLGELYYHFRIPPYSKSISRSLKKDNKLYLWDYSEVASAGSRLENLVASHLLKACHYWTDTGEGVFELFFLRNKEKQEIDFLITRDRKPWLPIEVKSRLNQPTASWSKFLPLLPCKHGIQVVTDDGVWKRYAVGNGEVIVMSLAQMLQAFV
ncbi:MAG: ATP-binding protein [Deltaproteobacteria bacterium]|nr:ATP-binding protein [Deltaproteobacteria bacterium]